MLKCLELVRAVLSSSAIRVRTNRHNLITHPPPSLRYPAWAVEYACNMVLALDTFRLQIPSGKEVHAN
jgi:hypothetical protein